MACAWPNPARAQYADGITGNFSVSETWTVTIAEDNSETPKFSKTYHGTATGTLTITDGSYTLIDKTGLFGGAAGKLSTNGQLIHEGTGAIHYPATWHTGGLNNARVIYTGGYGYQVNGSYPVAAFAARYAIVQLSFFVVKVELPVSNFAVPVLSGGGNDAYTTTGSSLYSLSGAGDETDPNTGFTASASSTSSLKPSGGSTKAAIRLSASPSVGGKVSGGGSFAEGSSHSVKATPNKGYSFAHWSENGEIVSTSADYTFTLAADTVLEADFVASPFTSVAGIYNGLFAPSEGVAPRNSGSFTAKVTTDGAFSGKLRLSGTTASLSGQFAADGGFSKTVNAGTAGSLSVVLQLDLTSGSGQLTGTVSGSAGVGNLVAGQTVFDGKNNVAPQFGQYTLIFAGANGSATFPGGNSYGAVSVDKAGKVKFAGVLADGTKLTHSASLSSTGSWPLFAPLYGGQGLVLSWIGIGANAAEPISGDLFWIKPSRAKAKYYPGGFAFTTTASGSVYAPPGKGANALTFTDGSLLLTGGGLGQSITNLFSLGPKNKVVKGSATNNLTLAFTPSTGLFQGTVQNPLQPKSKAIPFSGVVLQNQNSGSGFFTGTNQTGTVSLGSQ
jgi:hypothetical protein